MDKIDRIKAYMGNPVHPVYPCLNFAQVKINVHLQTKKGYKQNSCLSYLIFNFYVSNSPPLAANET